MTVQVAYGTFGVGSRDGNALPALQFETVTVCTPITESGTSQASSAAAPQVTPRPVARVAVSSGGADIYVTFGAGTPEATSGNGLLVSPGEVIYVGIAVGDKAAVITA